MLPECPMSRRAARHSQDPELGESLNNMQSPGIGLGSKTHHQNEDRLESCADENEDARTEHYSRRYLLTQLGAGSP